MNILGRARRMIQGLAPPEPPRPQFYQVACPEGHVLRGQRTEGYQALRCPTCGDGIFVLPRSPLPEPPAPPAPKSRARPTAVESWPSDAPIALSEPPPQVPDAEIEWLDPTPAPAAEVAASAVAPAPAPPATTVEAPAPIGPTAPKPRSKRPTPRPRAEPRRPKAGAVAAPIVAAAPAVPAVIRLRDWARRKRLPLTLAGVVVIVAATVALKTWQGRLEDLPHIVEVNRAEGLEALGRGRFDVAKVKLGIAANALERLGAHDAKAVELRQIADEAAILADLPDRTLEEILEEAVGFNPPAEWPSHFETIYRGRSILIDSTVKNVRGEHFDLDYQIYAGRGPRPRSLGRIAADGLTLFKGRALKDGQRLLFGARLASLTLDGDHWRFGLEPESGVLMNQFEALKSLGMDPIPDASAPEAQP